MYGLYNYTGDTEGSMETSRQSYEVTGAEDRK